MEPKLFGNLRFMKWLLKRIFLLLKNIHRGSYNQEPFDLGSTSFDENKRYDVIHDELDSDTENNKECK